MNWQRATTTAKKDERKEAIYSAALMLFKEKGYEKVSFNGIAAQANFTKSNMYRYFSSKEEIFLSIFSDLFESWFNDVHRELSNLEQSADLEIFTKVWVETYSAYPEFLDLIPILFTSLENNSSYEQLVIFKGKSKHLLYQLALDINQLYPELNIDKCFTFLTLSFAATSNYWAAESKQSDALKKLYQEEEFLMLKPNFKQSLTTAIEVTMKGLLAK